jgi:hypothetical protein
MFLLSAGMRAFTILSIVNVLNCSYDNDMSYSFLYIAVAFTQRKMKVLRRLYSTGTVSRILR